MPVRYLIDGVADATEVYTDGGVALRNPSDIGGSWAVRWIVGDRSVDASGYIKPHEVYDKVVTNNVTELIAALIALENVRAGWDGTLFTDSQVTMQRLMYPNNPKMYGLNSRIWARLQTTTKMVGKNFGIVLLAGHPNNSDLKRGHKLNGAKVSPHNRDVDKLCKMENDRLFIDGTSADVLSQQTL